MFAAGHHIVTFLWYGCDVLGFQVCCVRKISDSMVKWSEVILAYVVHLCCVLKLLEYSSAHCSVCTNLGTAFTYNERIQKSLRYRCSTQAL